MRRSEVTQLLEECVAHALRRGLERIAHRFVVAPAQTPVGKPAPVPPRKVFNVGRIDPSKSTLPIISEEEAKAIGGRETLIHFGLDPDLCPSTGNTF